MEILNCFLIALADLDQMLREFMSFRITMIEINREVASRAGLTFSSQVLKLAKVVSN